MTKRGMPSAAQMRVLEAMERRLPLVCSLKDGWYLDGGDAVLSATTSAMKRAGYIVPTGDPLKGEIWALTNLGRHALEAARASKGTE